MHVPRSVLAAVIILMALGLPAMADMVFTTTGSVAGHAVAGTADFSFGANSLTITLSNTSTIVGDISQELDGLAFTLTGASGLTLTNVAAAGFEDCTGSSGCQTVPAFHDGGGTGTVIPSPYDWGVTAAGVFAGTTSYHPAAIVNSAVTNTDGVSNGPHNDLLLGPVVFTFTTTGTPTNVSSVTFFWGTGGDTTPSTPPPSVPEAGTLAQLSSCIGFAGLGLAGLRRWRNR